MAFPHCLFMFLLFLSFSHSSISPTLSSLFSSLFLPLSITITLFYSPPFSPSLPFPCLHCPLPSPPLPSHRSLKTVQGRGNQHVCGLYNQTAHMFSNLHYQSTKMTVPTTAATDVYFHYWLISKTSENSGNTTVQHILLFYLTVQIPTILYQVKQTKAANSHI